MLVEMAFVFVAIDDDELVVGFCFQLRLAIGES